MEITEVKVFAVGDEKLKAFVSVVFDSCFMVNDIKVIQGRESLFISMPSRRKKNGQFNIIWSSAGLVSPDSYSSYLHPDGNYPAPTGGPK